MFLLYYQLLKQKVAIPLQFQLCSTSYTALETKNSMRSAPVTPRVTTKISTECIICFTPEEQLSITETLCGHSTSFSPIRTFHPLYTMLQMK